VIDVTAQGAAYAAGLAADLWDDYDALQKRRSIDRVFEPGSGQTQAQESFAMWKKAVERAKNWEEA
ncbi:MAG: glycerol kinase, partial [Elainellaceae cyanobacterium]